MTLGPHYYFVISAVLLGVNGSPLRIIRLKLAGKIRVRGRIHIITILHINHSTGKEFTRVLDARNKKRHVV